jgi:hypothetical protein
MSGYHVREIPLGVYGQPSKIREELEELEDALGQENRIMALCELSDLYGALKGVAETLGTNMTEVATMAAATERAFLDGTRKPRGKPCEEASGPSQETPLVISETKCAVLWDPPINKGTRFQLFDDRKCAEMFANHLAREGQMNVRLVEPGQTQPADVGPLFLEVTEVP